ncbi:hypothetical protein [Kitasatospora sp. NPDC057936]|uniref:hypothetical protein n=1 Tax=Kitasatospora sp. NPDC057936 TaxID=3346283 RepID=UPI0036DECFC9
MSTVFQNAALIAAASGCWYALAISTAAITAVVAPTETRRRDAREVLKVLVRRSR